MMSCHKEAVRILPDAECAVLFVHGICGTPRHFDFLLPCIPENVSYRSLLLEGHGGSSRDFSRSGMKLWQAQFDSAVAELARDHRSVLVCAHSMGCLLALENAIGHPDMISGMFLMALPLKIKYGLTALKTNLHTAFGDPKRDDPAEKAARECCGVELGRCLFDYLGWLPRYLELFALSRKVRNNFSGLKTPCTVIQSRKDELVSMKSLKFIEKSDIPRVLILEKSMHYYYPEDDRQLLIKYFGEMFE